MTENVTKRAICWATFFGTQHVGIGRIVHDGGFYHTRISKFELDDHFETTHGIKGSAVQKP